MKMFFAQLSDKSTINIPADRMYVEDNMTYVYHGDDLVAMVDVSMILQAHFSYRKETGRNEM